MQIMELSARNVERTYAYCHATPSTAPENVLKVSGVIHAYEFNKNAIEAHKEHIKTMLADLPDQFHEKLGGGWSFLMADRTRSGEQWTGLHQSMEMLFCLGIAAGYVKELPLVRFAEMPYYVVDVGLPGPGRYASTPPSGKETG